MTKRYDHNFEDVREKLNHEIDNDLSDETWYLFYLTGKH